MSAKSDRMNKIRKSPTKWSNLPADLLLEITSKLSLADQIRFRFVCKPWLSVPFQQSIRPMDKLPWSVTCDVIKGEPDHTQLQIECKLYDPETHEKPYSIFRRSIGDVEDFDQNPYTCSKTSKNGWVIFSKHDKDKLRTSFILFSPFTNEIIKLPDFYHSRHYDICMPNKMTFSSDPTSKECVFFIVLYGSSGKYKVSTYKHGDQEWITIYMKKLSSGSIDIESMMYFQGNLHCFNRKRLGFLVYNVAQQRWEYFETLKSQFGKNTYSEHRLLEFNGELLLVCIHKSNDSCHIYTFDPRSPSGWVAKTGLLINRDLFFDESVISVPESAELKHIENYSCEGTEYECLFSKKHFWEQIWIECPPHLIAKMQQA